MNPERLLELSRPFPPKYVHTKPGGTHSYISHHVINQRLIYVLGYMPSFEQISILRGDVSRESAKKKEIRESGKDLVNVIVGATYRMSLRDGTAVDGTGDCEDPHNWPHDGARLKDAESDALKRCAAKLGVGLHVWANGKNGNEYFLFDSLSKRGSAHPSLPEGDDRAEAQPVAAPLPVSPLEDPVEVANRVRAKLDKGASPSEVPVQGSMSE